MKKTSIAIILIIVLCFITGCNKAATAEETTVSAMETVKSGDVEQSQTYFGVEAFGDLDNIYSASLFSAIGERMTYEIISSDEGENSATVRVKITNVNVSSALTSATNTVFALLLADAFKDEAEQMTDTEKEQLWVDTIVSELDKQDKVSAEVEISLTKTDNVWSINPISEDVVKAILGGVSTVSIDTSTETEDDTNNESPYEKIGEIRNWLVADIWNDGFCDLSHYYVDGKNSIGRNMDADFTISELTKALEKKSDYDTYIKSLQDEKYDDLKEYWNLVLGQIDILYAEVQSRGSKQTGESLNTDLYNQYFDAFDDEYFSLN